MPFLLALACASNIGSAASLIAGLFVVNHGLHRSGMQQHLVERCRELGVQLGSPQDEAGFSGVIDLNSAAYGMDLGAARAPVTRMGDAVASSFEDYPPNSIFCRRSISTSVGCSSMNEPYSRRPAADRRT